MRSREIKTGIGKSGGTRAVADALGVSMRTVQRWARAGRTGGNRPSDIHAAQLRGFFQQHGYTPPPTETAHPLSATDRTHNAMFRAVTGKPVFDASDTSYRNMQRMIRDAGGKEAGIKKIAELTGRREATVRKWVNADKSKRTHPNKASRMLIADNANEVRRLAAAKAAKGRIARLRRQPTSSTKFRVRGQGGAVSDSEFKSRRRTANLDQAPAHVVDDFYGALAAGEPDRARRILEDAFADYYIDGLGFQWDRIDDIDFYDNPYG